MFTIKLKGKYISHDQKKFVPLSDWESIKWWHHYMQAAAISQPLNAEVVNSYEVLHEVIYKTEFIDNMRIEIHELKEELEQKNEAIKSLTELNMKFIKNEIH